MADSHLVYELAQGNPGALTVVSRLDYHQLVQLELTALRASMIWVGYKDICHEDIEEFKKMLNDKTLEPAVKKTPDWKYLNGRNR